jgi:PleD family two-component response regulator
MTLIRHDCAAATRCADGQLPDVREAAMRSVLVVDDDASMRDLLAEELRLRGYSVIVARNGREALDRTHVMTPDGSLAGEWGRVG